MLLTFKKFKSQVLKKYFPLQSFNSNLNLTEPSNKEQNPPKKPPTIPTKFEYVASRNISTSNKASSFKEDLQIFQGFISWRIKFQNNLSIFISIFRSLKTEVPKVIYFFTSHSNSSAYMLWDNNQQYSETWLYILITKSSCLGHSYSTRGKASSVYLAAKISQ
jgi:hypothetical protein